MVRFEKNEDQCGYQFETSIARLVRKGNFIQYRVSEKRRSINFHEIFSNYLVSYISYFLNYYINFHYLAARLL